MSLPRYFIDRPIFAGVISIVILLAGLLAMFRLPVSEYPEVVPPQIVVNARYPGANPKVIAETVATPLEEAWRLLHHHRIRALPVVDRARRVIGVVTLRIRASSVAGILEESRGTTARTAMLVDGGVSVNRT